MLNIPTDLKMHFELLTDAFTQSDKVKKLTVKKCSKHYISNNICCFQGGLFPIYMNKEDRLLAYAEGLTILGLTNFHTNTVDIYIKPAQTSIIFTLSAEEAKKIIKEKNLYESIIYVLSNNIVEFFHTFEKTITSNNYSFIRILLMDLNQTSDAVKTSVTVASYIMKRSGLSRSYVMMVLSELRKGDYITMEDGKLISINSLPEKF
ncbi:helix-turn-helix domain-containing protein [Jinshanibacter sp. LJY008]|uniref:Helix-turn-helix domain-containing protein n=1 Tax=Limnobaculum eriocheiris TaxID=2897391 RepID=A0A9X1SK00_9GAMM|nr:helix-turn-helix domain-containing protein [Limnobaculum eriocheiris]MCD1125451.1 helix-turn-helix domain-containing protein [Limnobaculum eriocheiris]